MSTYNVTVRDIDPTDGTHTDTVHELTFTNIEERGQLTVFMDETDLDDVKLAAAFTSYNIQSIVEKPQA
ncbi:hypothetical protein G3R49_19325 [Shewanella sp. WXL01]|uniref:hypothetical protein n=1 Tax=Shewanella sp. WXL01 TaxID=2709721 RepID=UPI00143842CA|nr:hypothetical protein [Shewanella sp. WXL01]NKF52711.1 hypothetical protein [Shewanella sp. WXL01]